eukprot:TRINITY_DN42906_c0_g1_i1.p1 TRINITY_DN42906_c0_g1~~TRINITY_DN42906_c0_g1_i1.p1  ORF type:complete len:395 (+),score=53.06 TRINITY_DN42906_c0_g1_i1:112-1296(+)
MEKRRCSMAKLLKQLDKKLQEAGLPLEVPMPYTHTLPLQQPPLQDFRSPQAIGFDQCTAQPSGVAGTRLSFDDDAIPAGCGPCLSTCPCGESGLTRSFTTNSLPGPVDGRHVERAEDRSIDHGGFAKGGICGSIPSRQPRGGSFLREHRLRQEAAEATRVAQDERMKNELLHRHLWLIGEANEWSKELGYPTRYCAYKQGDGTVVCHVYEDDTFTKEISLELFERRYQTLRTRRGGAAASPAEAASAVAAAWPQRGWRPHSSPAGGRCGSGVGGGVDHATTASSPAAMPRVASAGQLHPQVQVTSSSPHPNVGTFRTSPTEQARLRPQAQPALSSPLPSGAPMRSNQTEQERRRSEVRATLRDVLELTATLEWQRRLLGSTAVPLVPFAVVAAA